MFSVIITVLPPYMLYVGVILALFSFYIGGDSFLENLIIFGRSRNVSSINIGLFLVSFGTVIDELGVVVFASLGLHGDISFGTLQGSNIFTMILMMGVIALWRKNVDRRFVLDLAILALPLIILIIVNQFSRIVPWYIGALFVTIFAIYIAAASRRRELPVDINKEKTDYLSIFLSLALIGSASYAVVHYVTVLSHTFHIGYFIASFIIIGIAGSLPEIFTIMLSLRKRIWDMTVGIAIGSSIYKGLLLLGVAIMSSRISVSSGLYSVYAMLAITILLLASAGMNRGEGF